MAPNPSDSVRDGLADRAQSITIRVQSSVAAGATLCFEVVCYAGVPAVSAEVEEVILSVTGTTTADGTTTLWCVRIPNGCSGSTVNITAVGPGGQVATASVAIT
jgi:hypothetical protein